MEDRRVFRNEWKYLISYREAELLKRRLLNVMKLDPNAGDNGYFIRSLYFDDMYNSAYNEKLMGVYFRKKWRVRIYNYSDSRISLERKIKEGSYIYKESVRFTRDEFEQIINKEYDFLLSREENLCKEFYFEIKAKGLRPKVIVDYDRLPLVLDEGTVRITFDRELRACNACGDIFSKDLISYNCLEPDKLVLEVKYTEFLPQIVKQLLPLDGQEFTALSKYVLCYEKMHFVTDQTSGIVKSETMGNKL